MADEVSSEAQRLSKFRYNPDLFKMFYKVSSHLTKHEVDLCVCLAGRKMNPPSLKNKIKNGRDLFIALFQSGCCDESNFVCIMQLLQLIKREDLIHMIHLRDKRRVAVDPVEEYLITTNRIPQNHDQTADCSQNDQTMRIDGRDRIADPSPSTSSDDRVHFPAGSSTTEPAQKKLRRSPRHLKPLAKDRPSGMVCHPTHLKQKYTCDVRLRVRAEYCNYETALQGTVSSNKQDPLERQSECFSQASAILRSRDLGYIVCDIKFSEITYLDAFWRDYLNGSLLEALKGVFITETLKQAVGNESIKLLVNVEEEDYEKGRVILLKNLKNSQ